MNDERRFGLERRFDGEAAPGDCQAELGVEDLAYLERLSVLRKLARAHDPAASVPPRSSLKAPRTPRWARLAGAALAAGILALVVATRPESPPRHKPVLSQAPPAQPSHDLKVANRPASRPSRPSAEATFYRWANEEPADDDRVARAFLAASTTRRGRSTRREILALELANATTDAAGRVARSGTLHAVASHATNRRHSGSSRARPASPPKA